MAAAVIGNQDNREVLRCEECNLVQFSTVSKTCRKCHVPYEKVVEEKKPDIPFLVPEPIERIVVNDPNIQLGITLALRFFRNARGLSQADMCRRLGVPRTWISKFENAKCMPTLPSLVRLAEALELTVYFLMLACEEFTRSLTNTEEEKQGDSQTGS